jgi:hypothetical protein
MLLLAAALVAIAVMFVVDLGLHRIELRRANERQEEMEYWYKESIEEENDDAGTDVEEG